VRARTQAWAQTPSPPVRLGLSLPPTTEVSRVAPTPFSPCRRHYPGAAARVASPFPADRGSLPRFGGGSACALLLSGPARRSHVLRPVELQMSSTSPPFREAPTARLPALRRSRSYLAGATLPGRDFHPLGLGALSRRTPNLQISNPKALPTPNSQPLLDHSQANGIWYRDLGFGGCARHPLGKRPSYFCAVPY
jgi:hypothetical protein